MFARWIDPHVRTSIALAVLILSITGLVLADRGSRGPIWPSAASPVMTIATSPGAADGPTLPTPTFAQFRDRGAHGRFALSHGRLLANGTRPLFAEIRIAADDSLVERNTSAPVAFVLVIDTSGSMAGQKIVDARRSALSMLDQMREQDQVAVIRFATDANVVVPMMPVGSARHRARNQIERMSAAGNTDIANALRTAASVLDATYREGPRRIVLVTDGRDTSGAPRHMASSVAAQQSASGVTVSALGIGHDYDDAYLADLASAGRGNYEYLRDSSALDQFLAKEIRETARTTIVSAVAEIDTPRGVRVRDVWGAGWDRTADTTRLRVGSLFAGDERRVLVTFDVDAGDPGTITEIRSRLAWTVVGGERIEVSLPAIRVESVSTAQQVDNARDLSVLASVASVAASRNEVEAARAFERGDRDTALRLNAANVAALDAAAAGAPAGEAQRLRAQMREYERHQSVYSTQPPSAAPARAIGAQEHRNADRSVAY